MRRLNAILSLAVATLALPALAEAKGGGILEGKGNRDRGSRAHARPAAAIQRPTVRSFSAPRAVPVDRSPAPRREAPRREAPRRAESRPRDLSVERPVHSGGQSRVRTAARTAPRSDHAAAIRGNPDFRTVEPGERLRTGTRREAPGFRVGSRGRPGAPGATAPRATGFSAPASVRTSPSNYRVGYGDGWRGGYRVGYRNGYGDASGWHPHRYHDWYDRNHWYLSFSFGAGCGPYYGVSYYHPFRSWTLGVDYAFFYPAPVSHCYVPFGFYSVYEPVYVTRHTTVIRETVPAYTYETRTVYTTEEIESKVAAGEAGPVEAPAEEPQDGVQVAEPKPAAGSPATEKMLREASDLFRKKEYYDAAVQFRLAAISSPDLPGPLFALGQSLLALGQDAYAAKVLRKAVLASPALLEETADLVGVYESQAEFDRVLRELEARAAAAPADGDARFLLGYQLFFSGDPRCREVFDGLHQAAPADAAVNLFRTAVDARFKAAADLPPLPPK